ncbi:MAG TPA: AAA family ATPase [Bryobacteraceae bacterium]|nr:AAA family ATPase [Bryobacteraceae bacterium]
MGREGPMTELNACFQKILEGRRQVVFITGESGIGKTTVSDAFERSLARGQTVCIARGQCLEGFGGKEPYYPLLEALGQLSAGPAGAFVLQILSRHAPTWLVQFPSLLTAAEREALQKEIFGASRQRMLREICEALEAIAASTPLLLVLEDLHWADHSTLDVISAVARRRSLAKLILLGTFRTIDVILSKSPLNILKQDLLIHGLCREISLRGLAEQEIDRYLQERFPGAHLPSALASALQRHSGGNPMFMVAIVNELIKTGALAQREGLWSLTVPLASLKLSAPDTLRRLLDLQIDQLNPSERRILQCGSVAGSRFSPSTLAAVLHESPAQVEHACAALLKRQQFIQVAAAHGNGHEALHYEFRHSLYRETLYLQLPPATRADYHLRLAQTLETMSAPAKIPELASELALHFEHARDFERAAHYLVLSASNAARRFAHGDSVQALTRALELLARVSSPSAPKLEISVLERLSDAHYAMGEMPESAEADRKVAHLASELGIVTAQVDALARLARALAFLDPDGCVAVCERAEEICAQHADTLLHARARLLAACWRVVNNGWNARDSAVCAEARQTIRRLHGADLPAYYEILYAHVQSIQGEYLEACKTADSGIPQSVETHSLVVYLSALSSKALALLHLGYWGELRRVAETAISMAAKNGNQPWEGIFRAILAWLSLEATDWEGAQIAAAGLLDSFRDDPPGQVRSMALLTAAFASVETGQPARALQAFLRVRDRPAHPKFFLQWYWRIIAQLGHVSALLEMGDLHRARHEMDAFLDSALATADPSLKVRALNLQARLLFAEGNPTRARQSVDRALAALKPSEPPPAAWRIHWTAAQLCQATGDSGGADFHKTVARAILRHLADSLEPSDPLRAALLRTASRELPPPRQVTEHRAAP